MLRGVLLHPGLLAALARCGHGSRILICDALYPQQTHANRSATRIELNLRAGLIAAGEILAVVAASVHLEAATFMADADGGVAPPVAEFQELLSGHRHGGDQAIAWSALERYDFYDAARAEEVAVVIVSGEVRPYANLLLTVGVP